MKLTGVVTNYAKNALFAPLEGVRDGIDYMQVINLYPEITDQEIKGFGGAFTEAAAYNLSLLSKEKQREVMEGYFGKDGLCYSLCRTHINSCDFALGNYAYVEDETDTELKSFSVARDERYLIPMIQEALRLTDGKLALLASPWSPPAFMKTNGEMNHGGELKKEYEELWARYIAAYIKAYKEHGIDISMLTVQNEPMAVQTWDSCIYTAERERDFVKEHLGPVLKAEGLSDVKLLVWDHNKEILYDRAKTVYEDKEASVYAAGAAFHWYSGDHFEAVELLHKKYPEKELYFTEGCVEYSRFMDSNEIYKAEMYAHDLLGNLNAGTNGYIDWNLLLDEQGGPNHVGNFCAAPVMCNPKEDTVEKRLSYYYIGHFSRYIKPGARRIAATRYTDALEVCAFLNPDNSRVCVLLNRTERDVPVSLREGADGAQFTVEAHSVVTVQY